MAKRLTTDDHLALLRQLRAAPRNEHRVSALAELLTHSHLHGIVIKIAANLALDSSAQTLAPALIAAARSLMAETALKRDPGCEAKIAVAKCLLTWETHAPDFFLELAAYHQFEPSFGDPIDSAAECRGLAAIAIARLRPPDAIFLLTELLADPQKLTRANTALALGIWPTLEAAAVLHLKARLGDAEPEVLAEVFASLLRFDDPHYFKLITDQLNSADPPTIESAALALGQSKLSDALAPLTAAWESHRRSPIASTLLMSIALLRSEPSVDWLIAKIPTARPSEALAILDALAIYKPDEKIRNRLVPLTKSNPELYEALGKIFPA